MIQDEILKQLQVTMPSMGTIKAAQDISRRLDELIPNWDKGLKVTLDAQKRLLESQSAVLAMRDVAKIQPIAAQIFEAYRRMAPLMNHPALREVQTKTKALCEIEDDIPSLSLETSLLPSSEKEELIKEVDKAVENTLPFIPELESQLYLDGCTLENTIMMMYSIILTSGSQDQFVDWLQALWDILLTFIREQGNNPTLTGAINLIAVMTVLYPYAAKILKKTKEMLFP